MVFGLEDFCHYIPCLCMLLESVLQLNPEYLLLLHAVRDLPLFELDVVDVHERLFFNPVRNLHVLRLDHFHPLGL